MSATRLGDDEVRAALTALPAWRFENGRLRREYTFPDFVAAFGFMASMALVSEAMNHHPEWSNVYARVVIELQTHDAGGVTGLDLRWAERSERVFEAKHI